MKGMEQTVPLRICHMREVLHVVNDALLEAYVVGQEAMLPPVNVIPARRGQVHNLHFLCDPRMNNGSAAAGC
jgi:hypothetical protein